MTKILTLVATLSLLGCASEAVRPQQQVMVTAIVIAPHLISMSEPPTSPQMQFSETWDFSKIVVERESGSSWIEVPICSGSGQNTGCVPSIGDVKLTSRIAPKNKGIVDVEISLSNDAEIRTEVGGGKSRLHKHVGTTEEKVSYGVLRGEVAIDLVPGAVSSVELPHGITLTVRTERSEL